MSDFGRPSPPDLSVERSLPDRLASQIHLRGSAFRIEELPLGAPYEFYASLRRNVCTSFILESAPGPERLASFTFVGFDPQHVIALQDGELRVDGRLEGPVSAPLAVLQRVLSAHRPPVIRVRRPKYLGGLVGYVGYDLVRHLDRLPNRHLGGRSPFPDVEMGLYLDGVIYDHREERACYFTWGEDRSAFVRSVLREGSGEPASELRVGPLAPGMTRKTFTKGVERALGAIRAGEVYQLVLSRKLTGEYRGDLFAAYRALRRINPSPYMYCLEFNRGGPGERAIVGSSPEMLLSVQGRTVTTYPIAGTRPLGRDEAERRRLREELLSDEKERAEHNMLVDLARNDVGRVAAFGSVRVPKHMKVERFSHVQHLVSRVEGRLRKGLDAFDAFAALFPAGTVTGAPKVRAMEWIDRLEGQARGPYAGVVGYFSLTGDMDAAIAIRTLFASRGELTLQAGAGVVADSVPEREWEETGHKLGALVDALGGEPS